MNTYIKVVIPILLILLIGCLNTAKKEKKSESATINRTNIDSEYLTIKHDSSQFVAFQKETTNEKSANKISAFLFQKFKDELTILNESDCRFSFYELDLNGDGINEYFVRLEGQYFCGSGGCSFFLLNNNFTTICYFTVTNPPIFISSKKTNGWHDLILFGDKEPNKGTINYIHLQFDASKGKYPTNPSLLKKINLAPSGHDFAMWHEYFSLAKPFNFCINK